MTKAEHDQGVRALIFKYATLRNRYAMSSRFSFVSSLGCAVLAVVHSPESPTMVGLNLFAAIGSALIVRTCSTSIKRIDRIISELRKVTAND